MEQDQKDCFFRPAKILVVEDERYIARFLMYILAEEGYEVQAVYDGEEAMAAVSSFAPDAVLLDLLLPKLSGQAVIARLRSDPRFNRLKILLLTGCPLQDGDAGELQNMGADAYCLKPIGPSVLINLLKQHGLPPRLEVGAAMQKEQEQNNEDIGRST